MSKSNVLKLSAQTKKKETKPSYEELEALSTLDFHGCESDLDRLYRVRELVERTLPISEGLFKKDPNRANTYALTNVVERYQNITQQIIDVNNSAIIDDLLNILLKPFIERMLLELGTIINEEIYETSTSNKVKRKIDSVYSKFGFLVEDKLPKLELEIKNLLR